MFICLTTAPTTTIAILRASDDQVTAEIKRDGNYKKKKKVTYTQTQNHTYGGNIKILQQNYKKKKRGNKTKSKKKNGRSNKFSYKKCLMDLVDFCSCDQRAKQAITTTKDQK
ncbi:unnamed protein product [Ceratitis capitata]|uniref:(Mediterranean fruit fly) hypothetical protein n=1 Tax=Ceratitis capitata TaxID=7213 RepID=A0A811V6G1_CERCA|nr:unnamed protein product [Ceratitis capitata]